MLARQEPDSEELIQHARDGNQYALGQLLARYRNYLGLLARLQIGRRLQGKVDASDVVQDASLKAYRHFPQFRGQTEKELVSWLRQILLSQFITVVRHYHGSRRRDLRLERELAAELDRSSRSLDPAMFAKVSSPSQQAVRRVPSGGPAHDPVAG